ncbi:MAG TPA: MBL fold metallo-hydrolase [Thermomicrobiales bacterium]|jgi:phosphoribosyl 1,2-cyclic phosphate phosphodiesterase
MRAQFLGTAASEGYPNPFCGCDNCRRAQELGGPNLRKRSSLLIDGELLIDLGPDVLAAAQMHGIALTGIRYCLQTHEHDDHLHPALLLARSPYCGVLDAPLLHFYATQGTLDRAIGAIDHVATLGLGEACARLNLAIHSIEPFQTFTVGPYRVDAVLAAHDPTLTPLLYIIERDSRSLFYATDTCPLPERTWASLQAWGGRFDVVIMDHTFGYGPPPPQHLNGEQFLGMTARLREVGLLADDARVYATHIAHHGNPVHDELVAHAAKHGYLVAHDGLTITIENCRPEDR